jgi:hypothetical protein
MNYNISLYVSRNYKVLLIKEHDPEEINPQRRKSPGWKKIRGNPGKIKYKTIPTQKPQH